MLATVTQLVWLIVGIIFLVIAVGLSIFTGWMFMHWRDVDIQHKIDQALKEFTGEK